MSDPRSCEGCAFWRRGRQYSAEPVRHGECRRESPRRNQADYGERRPWGRTDADDWCGDWREKPEARLDE
jgi:hypothetical protein